MEFILIREFYSDLQNEFRFLRKEPRYLPIFKKMKEDEEKSASELENLYNHIRDHKNTFKQNKMDLMGLSKSEDFWDMITKAEMIEKFNKFTKLLPSHLRGQIRENEKMKMAFITIFHEFAYEDYKNNFLKKVAKYRTPKDLYRAAENHLKGNENQKVSSLVSRLETDDEVKIWYVEGDIVIALIYSRKASCRYGSQSWCISGSSGGSWDSYIVRKPPGVQYFIWDLSKEATNNMSLLGVTIYSKEGELRSNNYGDDYGSYSSGYIAQDKSDSPINIKNKPWFRNLKDFFELDKEIKKNYLIYNPSLMEQLDINNLDFGDDFNRDYLMKNPQSALNNFTNVDFLSDEDVITVLDNNPELIKSPMFRKRITEEQKHHYQISLFERDYEHNPWAIEKDFDNLNFLPQEKLEELVSRHPDLMTVEIFYVRLDKEIISRLIMEHPEKAYKFKKEFLQDVIKDEDNYRQMIFTFLDKFKRRDEDMEDVSFGYNAERVFNEIWGRFPKMEYLENPDFITSLFKENPTLSFEYLSNMFTKLEIEEINDMWKTNHKEFVNVFKSLKTKINTKIYDQIKSYFKGPWRRFSQNDLWVFNARIGKKDITPTDRSKRIFEEILEIESLIKFQPFRNSNIVGMMKMRAVTQGDLSTYGVWVEKDFFEGEDEIHDFSEYGGQTAIDFIDENKFKM